MPSRIHHITIAAFVATLAGGSRAAALGLADSSTTVYQGCLQRNVGVLYGVKVNPSTPLHCRRGDKLIGWDQTGPAGAIGGMRIPEAPISTEISSGRPD